MNTSGVLGEAILLSPSPFVIESYQNIGDRRKTKSTIFMETSVRLLGILRKLPNVIVFLSLENRRY